VVVLLNGAFGVGKTTVARLLAAGLPGASIFDPERIGFVLRRLPRFVPLAGRGTDDFQDLALWRSLTVRAARARARRASVLLVPMAFSNRAYLDEIRAGIARGGSDVRHFCLTAAVEVVHARLRARGGAGAWELRRAAECCAAHADPSFAEQIPTAGRSAQAVADELAARLAQASPVAIGTSSESPHSAQEPS
jgi:predicted kinase